MMRGTMAIVAAAALLLLLLGACRAGEGAGPPDGRKPATGKEKTMSENAQTPSPPPGAIPIGDDVYAVPIGKPDADGCQRYRLWSPTKMVVQAIHYRRADGRFTMRKDEAACHRKP